MKNSNAFILLLISAALVYTFILPEYGKVSALRTEASDYQTTLANISELSASRDALLQKYKALSPDDVNRLTDVLPDHVDPVSFALNLDTIASRYGIALKSVSTTPQPTTPDLAPDTSGGLGTTLAVPSGPAYGYMDVDIKFVSTYENFQSFVADLEKSVQIIDVRSATFLISETGLSEFDVSLRTYWLK